MDRAANIRAIKAAAKEPKIKKAYSIPKVSEKRKKQIIADKELLEQDAVFYKEVYAASPHACQNCGITLPKTPSNFMFHHLLE
jgi:hypothetical protein